MLLIKVEIFVSALSFMKEKIVYQECQVGSQVNYLQRHIRKYQQLQRHSMELTWIGVWEVMVMPKCTVFFYQRTHFYHSG